LKAANWLLFSAMAWSGFWYVSLIAQQEYYSDWYQDRFTNLLPFLITCYVMYLSSKKYLLPRKFLIERCLLYVLPIWIGVHIKYFTFFAPDFDLSSGKPINSRNPTYPVWAMILTLVLLGLFVLIFAIFQIRDLYYAARLPKLLSYYAVVISGFLITFGIVHKYLVLHFHHYFIGILLWPATCLNTRLSMFLQALLFGLFINGVSRWGFASLLEWSAHVELPYAGPSWLNVTSVTATSISLRWEAVHLHESVYSLTLNDMLAYVGSSNHVTLTGLPENSAFTLCVGSFFSGIAEKCTAYLNVTTAMCIDQNCI
jgi:hypothetical protein